MTMGIVFRLLRIYYAAINLEFYKLIFMRKATVYQPRVESIIRAWNNVVRSQPQIKKLVTLERE